jgi:hypothetical protein
MGIGSFTVDGMAYRYDIELNVYQELPNLPPALAERFMAGAAISDDGTLIGGGTWGTGPATFGTGFIWEEGVGTMTAMDYLISKGFSEDDWGAGFEISFVSAMSSDGLWIGGWGRPAGGGNVSWAAYLGGTAIPEPACAGFAGILAVVSVCTRRRRQTWPRHPLKHSVA